jgi:hypothetical protein
VLTDQPACVSASLDHLSRYVDEFAFRHNNCTVLEIDDQQLTTNVLAGIEGKRLTYRQANYVEMIMQEPTGKPFRSVLADHSQHVHAIGMISVELANLEMYMGQMLGALIGIDRKLAEIIYLTPKTGFGRIEVLENVVAHVLADGSEGQKRLRSLLGRAKSIMQKRHGLVHVVWVESQSDMSQVYRMPVPIKDPSNAIAVPLQDLTTLVENIRTLTGEIMKETWLLTAHRIADATAAAQVPPSPPTSSEPGSA